MGGARSAIERGTRGRARGLWGLSSVFFLLLTSCFHRDVLLPAGSTYSPGSAPTSSSTTHPAGSPRDDWPMYLGERSG
jgi:hypothetical protein